MNLATTGGTLTSMPAQIGPIDGPTRVELGPDADSIDPTAPGGGDSNDAQFAQVLTRRISDNDAKDDATAPASTPNAKAATTESPQPERATQDAIDDRAKDAIVDTAGDAIGNDLAAQLALVSQWNQGAPQTAATKAGTSADLAPSELLASGNKSAASLVVGGDPVRGDPTASADARGVDLAANRVANDARLQNDFVARSLADSARIADVPVVSTTALPLPDTSANGTLALATNIAASLATTHAQPVTATSVATSPTLSDMLRQPVGTPAWSHEVGNAMVRMAVGDLQSAALRLNPEHLGPLDVQVRIDNGVAHLAFHAAHAETRQAIEASRTVLHQLFAEQGLKIGDCAVGDSSSRRAGFDADGSHSNASMRDGRASRTDRPFGEDAAHPVAAASVRVSRSLGMVDTFA